ncbi:cbb3-type cytochrome c oxidase N-terminal domain-containing protein [Pleomorphovibrio marinus]|uniref:cbb3-type cytochrome c oxidase N-terminal domain-containing protein n=1 Tax=Pleomorphovibrio marinus TaxID=2164132 RepID=UPI001E28C619|nr:cbb3-type cytochrome c oxidase N-terminal domain-containing protein [Pleomorphovibrio marinus]
MKINKLLPLFGLLVTVSGSAFAQSETQWINDLSKLGSSEVTLLVIIGIVLLLIVALMGLLLYFLAFLKKILQPPVSVEQVSWWQKFNEKYISGQMKPVEKEKDIMMDHSYDGIVELDNFMPPWLKYLFYSSILFAVVYVFNYLVLGFGKTQIEEYEEELRVAAVRAEERMALAEADIDENTVQFDASGPSIRAGQTLYEANCAACHAVDGGGGVGPNLTDEYWIHGGAIEDIFTVVKYGVIEKGMVPWQDQMSPLEMQQVSSYVLTLVGTTPSNPKEPQGEPFEPAIEEPTDALTDDELELTPAE